MATGPGREIDQQPIIPQHTRADQDLVAIHECRLHSNRPAIEQEIDKEDFFLDSLICRQKGRDAANQLRVQVRS